MKSDDCVSNQQGEEIMEQNNVHGPTFGSSATQRGQKVVFSCGCEE